MAATDEDAALLLMRAQACLDSFPPQTGSARECFEECHKLHPNNCDVLEAFADFLMRFDLSSSDRAVSLLQHAVALKPNCDGHKFLSLAQLTEGRDALELYSKGLTLLQVELSKLKTTPKAQGSTEEATRLILQQMSSAECAVAELYMTELCDDEDAKEQCLLHLKKAAEADPSNFDAHHVTATYFKTVGEHDSAEEAAFKALALLRHLHKHLGHMSNDSDDEMSGGIASEDHNKNPLAVDLPSAESRVNFCGTLIDLLMVDEATEVILGLLEEDEEDAKLWHLLAIVCLLSEEYEDALSHIARAKQLISTGSCDEVTPETLSDLEREVRQRTSEKSKT